MKRRGIGYACMIYGTGYGNGFPDESRATVELLKDGLVMVSVEATDIGQGAKNIMRQIAAASRQTYNTGNAVLDGCRKFKRQFFDPFIKEDRLEKEKSHSLILKWLYNKFSEDGIEAKTKGYFKANTTSVNLETGQGSPYWPYTFSVNKAVVQVDDETGKVDVLELIACHDSGKIINPLMAQGQIEGDCAMGLGEPSMISTAPAILNAIYDAVGVRIRDLPATCERVLLAIKNKERDNG